MNAIRVWAPNARRVTVQLERRRLPMEQEGGEARGWWRLRWRRGDCRSRLRLHHRRR